MNIKWIIAPLMLMTIASPTGFALNNAPIQRIDIVNNLWNSALGGSGGQTQTSVKIELDNGSPSPCFTKILPFQGDITVYAGIGQSCINKVVAITVTPYLGPGTLTPSYDVPAGPSAINNTQYLTQIVISQNSAPVYDAINGSLIMKGTVLTTIVSN